MLLRLFVFRMGPLALLHLCRERRKIKRMLIVLFCVYAICLVRSVFALFEMEKWNVFFYLPLAAMPQFFLYGFAGWLLFRCVFEEWSERVWKRIYGVSCVVTFLGILVEIYINPQILNFFVKNI